MYGLNRLNKLTHTIDHYFVEDGLPGNAIQSIEKDTRGYYWISTHNGLCRFNPQLQTYKNFSYVDGLQGNEFIKNASYQLQNGDLLFGGVNGFNLFNPYKFKKNTIEPPVVLTGFLLFDHPVNINDPKAPFHKSVSCLDEIILSYDQNVFTFFYAVLNYVSSTKNQYAYQLVGFDKDWIHSDFGYASYTNISPGTYELRVKGANNDGIWNEEGTSIRIVIRSPFWATLWFRLSMLVVFSGLIVGIVRLRTVQFQKEQRILEKKVVARTSALEKAQKQLLVKERLAALGQIIATVAHEIRNPLGTIRSSVFTIKEAYCNEEETRMDRAMGLAERNIVRCDNIITELLDFTRSRDIKKDEVDFDTWLEQVINDQEIPDSVVLKYMPASNAHLRIGRESFRRVVVNLIENAIQAIQSQSKIKGQIDVATCLDEGQLIVEIKDNGPGIPEETLEKIFEPLYSTKGSGVGLGLAIVKKIIELHHGRIKVESNPPEMTRFVLSIPLTDSDV